MLKDKTKQSTIFKMMVVSLAAFMSISLTACGSASSDSKDSSANYEPSISKSESAGLTGKDVANNAPASEERVSTDAMGEVKTENQNGKEQKLIYSSNVSISTLDYEKTLEDLDALIKENKIIVQEKSSFSDDNYYRGAGNTSQRHTNIFLRVPMENYEAVLNGFQNLGHITNNSQTVEDITKRYYDAEARLEVLEIEKERLLDWLSKANTIEEMLQIEKRLSEVQQDIERVKNSLEIMGFDVGYSKIWLDITEVYRYDAPSKINVSFATELKDTFKDSFVSFGNTLRNLALALVFWLPYIVIFLVVFFIFNKNKATIKAKREKRRAEKEKKREEKMGYGAYPNQKEENTSKDNKENQEDEKTIK